MSNLWYVITIRELIYDNVYVCGDMVLYYNVSMRVCVYVYVLQGDM